MTQILTKFAYKKLIDENIEWLLENTEDTLERVHILLVLEASIDMYYPQVNATKKRDVT